jgi:hypothetical protein
VLSAATAAWLPTGRPRGPGMVRAPHRGAHLVGRLAAKQRGRDQPQTLRFSSRSTRTNRKSRKGGSEGESDLMP